MVVGVPEEQVPPRWDRGVSWYHRLSISQKLAAWAWLFLAVPIVFYVVIRFYPTFHSFYLSFTDWNIVGAKNFVGLDNYVRMLSDETFWKVFERVSR